MLWKRTSGWPILTNMKFLLTICLLLISIPSNASSQRSTGQRPALTRAQIKEAERQLAERGYWTGTVDGIFDRASRTALTAFQKWESRAFTDGLTLDEFEAILTSTFPRPREVGYEHVEVDLDRQVLLLVDEQGSVKILPVSTGNGKPFDEEGQTSIAYTPRGRFIIYDKTAGWETGYFGSMYYSNYISGGVAIHGSPSVPSRPASHGCIRVPMFAARELSRLLPLGTIVLVYDKVSFVSAKPWIENPRLKPVADIE
jgi:hypothetical protein